MNICGQCEGTIPITQRFCSNKCQADWQFAVYIEKWKKGEVDGSRGVHTKNLSRHLIRYITDKYDTCAGCGWDKTHPLTGDSLLEIDHIDGDSTNNIEDNLRVLCPNCHAMTPNFKNRNYGKGREWRKLKYIRTA